MMAFLCPKRLINFLSHQYFTASSIFFGVLNLVIFNGKRKKYDMKAQFSNLNYYTPYSTSFCVLISTTQSVYSHLLKSSLQESCKITKRFKYTFFYELDICGNWCTNMSLKYVKTEVLNSNLTKPVLNFDTDCP